MTHPESTFRIVPLPADVVQGRRQGEPGGPGQPQIRQDNGRHQCRSCLSLTRPGEEYLLFSHSPFPQPQPYAESGPVFIHRRDCISYAAAGEFPADFRRLDLVLRAYSEADEIVGAARVGERPVEAAIAELFSDPHVVYLHARNTEYGCFICRIERA